MKKIITMTIIATGMLTAGDINLGITQSNNIAAAVSATNNSKIKQGEVGVYGNSNVGTTNTAIVASANVLGGLVSADTESAIEQGTLEISDSNVEMTKTEVNGIIGGVSASDHSSIDQGKWKIVDVQDATVRSIGQTNAIVGGAIATTNSKISQGSISIGSVATAAVIVAAVPVFGGNKLLGGVLATNGSEVSQGSVVICGNTHLAECGN